MRHGEIVETVSAEDLHKGEGERHEYTQVLMSASEIAFGVEMADLILRADGLRRPFTVGVSFEQGKRTSP